MRALVWVSDAANDYLGIAEGPSDACTTPQGLSKVQKDCGCLHTSLGQRVLPLTTSHWLCRCSEKSSEGEA